MESEKIQQYFSTQTVQSKARTETKIMLEELRQAEIDAEKRLQAAAKAVEDAKAVRAQAIIDWTKAGAAYTEAKIQTELARKESRELC